MEISVLGLFKFSTLANLEKLQNEGLMYMNTPEFFKNYDTNSILSDPNEGLIGMYQSDKIEITFGNIKINQSTGLVDQVFVSETEDNRRNIFCMYALKYYGAYPKIDERNYKFGDHVLCITNAEIFKQRLVRAAVKYNVNLNLGTVQYVSKDHNGTLGIFKKFERYQYQSEFRIVISPGNGLPFKFYIGSLEDISIIKKTEEMQSQIKISPTSQY